jgi:hypothetical protein
MSRRLARWVVAVLLVVAGLIVTTTAGLIWWYRAPGLSDDPAALEREILALRASRDSVEARVRDRDIADELLARRPEGDVVLALPTPFVEALARDIVRGWFSAVDLRLRNLRVQKSGDVSARLGILGRRRVGSYALRLDLAEVQGTLSSGTPVLTFGGDRVGLTMPIRLVGGSGTGRATIAWESRGLARSVCGDVDASRPIEGTVAPANYVATGFLRLSATEGGFLIDPRFPGLSLRLKVRPSRRSVTALEELLASQGRLCNFAVDKANVEERILALVGRGFEVKIPQRFFRPVRVPISIDGAVPIVGTTLLLSATPDTLIITRHAVWLAANVAIKGAVKAPVQAPVTGPPSAVAPSALPPAGSGASRRSSSRPVRG